MKSKTMAADSARKRHVKKFESTDASQYFKHKVSKGVPTNRDQQAKRQLDWQASGHPDGVYLIDKITQAKSFGAMKTMVYNQFATSADMCAYLDEVGKFN